jgi:hypothetical protein
MYKKASTLTTLMLSMLLFVISTQAQTTNRRTAPNPNLDRGAEQCRISGLSCDPPVPISVGRGEDGNPCSASDQCGTDRNPGPIPSTDDSFIDLWIGIAVFNF